MKILITTKEKQGERKNDFCFCEEGEFVKFGMECDGETVDGGCGCRRSMVGFKTLKSTTTFKSADINITEKEYAKQYRDSETKAWGNIFSEKDINANIEILLSFANTFKVGEVLEKRGNKIQIRR